MSDGRRRRVKRVHFAVVGCQRHRFVELGEAPNTHCVHHASRMCDSSMAYVPTMPGVPHKVNPPASSTHVHTATMGCFQMAPRKIARMHSARTRSFAKNIVTSKTNEPARRRFAITLGPRRLIFDPQCSQCSFSFRREIWTILSCHHAPPTRCGGVSEPLWGRICLASTLLATVCQVCRVPTRLSREIVKLSCKATSLLSLQHAASVTKCCPPSTTAHSEPFVSCAHIPRSISLSAGTTLSVVLVLYAHSGFWCSSTAFYGTFLPLLL